MSSTWTKGAALAAIAIGIGAQSAQAAPSTITALTDGNSLVTVRADKPNKALNEIAITGLVSGESLAGIDRRPANGLLYTVISTPGQQAKVATIAPDGTIGNVKPLFDIASITTPIVLQGSSFGFDFNPAADRLRVNSDAEQNLRINVDTGATTVDVPLNPGDPSVVGAAYTNNDTSAATGTQLFDIDTGTDTLALQNPPNNGTLVTVGPLGFPIGGPVGFDIYSELTGTAATTNEPYASFAESNGTEKLYTVNLTTGAATEVGPFARKDIADIALSLDTTP